MGGTGGRLKGRGWRGGGVKHRSAARRIVGIQFNTILIQIYNYLHNTLEKRKMPQFLS